jgi:hypothetical protein
MIMYSNPYYPDSSETVYAWDRGFHYSSSHFPFEYRNLLIFHQISPLSESFKFIGDGGESILCHLLFFSKVRDELLYILRTKDSCYIWFLKMYAENEQNVESGYLSDDDRG